MSFGTLEMRNALKRLKSALEDLRDQGVGGGEHDHNDLYYTEDEIDTQLAGKSNTDHAHDDRYYTESEIDTELANKSDTTHLHDSRYYTESEVDAALDGKSDSNHNHDERYYRENEIDTLPHREYDDLNPSTPSFTKTTLSDTTNWQKLDLSSIVNSDCDFIFGYVIGRAGTGQINIDFKHLTGDNGPYCKCTLETANVTQNIPFFCRVSSQEIYFRVNLTPSAWNQLDIYITGGKDIVGL